MSMMKKIEIDGKAVAFKASAAIPRIYRIKFQRDIYKDLSVLERVLGTGIRKSLPWICFPLRCSRTLRM